jgi:ribonuclease R
MFTNRKIRIGDKVRIQVVAASLAKRQLDYDLIEPEGSAPEAFPGARPRSARKPDTEKRAPKGKKKEKEGSAKKKPASGKKQGSSSRKKP